MPEYLAPGVYVEETSFRAKSIEGVSTSTTAFAGPTRKGPTSGAPVLITSFGDFERIYGGFGYLNFGGGEVTNYIAHAVRNYFDNGGARLFMARVYNATGGDGEARSGFIGADTVNNNNLRFIARSPGRVGNGTVTVSLILSPVTTMALSRAPRGTGDYEGGQGKDGAGLAPRMATAEMTREAQDLLARIAKSPRFAGSVAEARARQICREHLEQSGFACNEIEFEFSEWPGRWGPPAAAVVQLIMILVVRLEIERSRGLKRGNRMLVDQLCLSRPFEQNRKLVEARDIALEHDAVDQEQCHGLMLGVGCS